MSERPIFMEWVLGARYIDMPHPDEHGMRVVGVVVPKNELTLLPKAALERALRPLLAPHQNEEPHHPGNDDHDAEEPHSREGKDETRKPR